MADTTIVVEHRMGARDRPGFVDEMRSWPYGDGLDRYTDNKDQPGPEVTDAPREPCAGNGRTEMATLAIRKTLVVVPWLQSPFDSPTCYLGRRSPRWRP